LFISIAEDRAFELNRPHSEEKKAFLVSGHEVSNAVVIYTDNTAVRDALISCCPSNFVARKILIATLALECERQLTPWYSKAPTDQNCADAPSCLSVKQLVARGAVATPLDVDACWDEMLRLERQWGEEEASASSSLKKSSAVRQPCKSFTGASAVVMCLHLQPPFSKRITKRSLVIASYPMQKGSDSNQVD
jgi:hypothetical protein